MLWIVRRKQTPEKYVAGAVTLSLLHYYKLIVEMWGTALGIVVVSAVIIFWYLSFLCVSGKRIFNSLRLMNGELWQELSRSWSLDLQCNKWTTFLKLIPPGMRIKLFRQPNFSFQILKFTPSHDQFPEAMSNFIQFGAAGFGVNLNVQAPKVN